MTTVALMADPPRAGLVLSDLADQTGMSAQEAATLYEAMLRDVASAIVGSGGDLLVNYRPEEALPATQRTGSEVEEVLRDTVGDIAHEMRFEPQVGESYSARVGNTITHLLESEGVQTAAVVDARTPLLSRTEIDSAAMKLRRSPVVIGPATAGRVYYAGFAEPIDFSAAFDPPAVRTLSRCGDAAGYDIDFLPMLPLVERARDLSTLVAILEARVAAGRPAPSNTLTTLQKFAVSTAAEGADLAIVRGTDND